MMHAYTRAAAAGGAAAGGGAGPVLGYADTVLASSPFAYWRFEETAGTTAADELENHDGTYVGSPDLNVSLLGSAAEFNGSTQYVSVGTLGGFGSQMSGGVSFEFSLSTDDPGLSYVLATANDGSNTFIAVEIGESIAGRLSFKVRADGGAMRWRYSDVAVNDGDKKHIIVTYAGDSGYPDIFINGALANGSTDSNSSGSTTPPSNFANFAYPLLIAGLNNRGSPDGLFAAIVDEVSIYNRRIQASEAANKYNRWAAEVAA